MTSVQSSYAEEQSKHTEKQIILNPEQQNQGETNSQKKTGLVGEKSKVREGEFSIEPYENGKGYTITVNNADINKVFKEFENKNREEIESLTINGSFNTSWFANWKRGFFTNLKELKGDVQNIPNSAFKGSENLENVSLPKVKEIGDNAFAFTYSLKEVSIPEVEVINWGAFMSGGITSMYLPKVKHIGDNAFFNNNLTELSLPEAIFIGSYAFDLNQISKLDVPKVKYVADGAFKGTYMKELSLPEAEYIGSAAFIYSYVLEKVFLPKVTYIGDYAFQNTAIKNVSLPTIIEMEKDALSGDMKQLQYVIFPKSSIEGVIDAFEESNDVMGIGYNSDEANQITAKVGDKVSLDIPVLNNFSGMDLKVEWKKAGKKYVGKPSYELTVKPDDFGTYSETIYRAGEKIWEGSSIHIKEM
ncbi:leucine-rich repeat domain-containing protein [Bacillus cereus]|uniref:leucine-rich repeat domain-containing protein n=1 Tax=Bacillus cereus TaxID=1396 RepID=UPI001596C130|nr:leucine-rich repeat domain-containing protein [Bacillus cereus]